MTKSQNLELGSIWTKKLSVYKFNLKTALKKLPLLNGIIYNFLKFTKTEKIEDRKSLSGSNSGCQKRKNDNGCWAALLVKMLVILISDKDRYYAGVTNIINFQSNFSVVYHVQYELKCNLANSFNNYFLIGIIFGCKAKRPLKRRRSPL